jgi:hypothetical protein
MRSLIEKGADVNAITSKGNNILMKMIQIDRDSFHLVRELLDRGTDISHQNQHNRNALHVACDIERENPDRVDTVKLLIRYGIPLHEKDKNGDTALDLAEYHKLKEITTILRKISYNFIDELKAIKPWMMVAKIKRWQTKNRDYLSQKEMIDYFLQSNLNREQQHLAVQTITGKKVKSPSPKKEKVKSPSPSPKKEKVKSPSPLPKKKVKSPKKDKKPFVIPSEIVKNLEESGYQLGELLGEGAFGIVYEVYKKDEKNKENRHVVKILKQQILPEIIQLRELGELVKQLSNSAYIIKYCGESLLTKWRREPNFMPLKDAVISLLEDLRRIHKKGWLHGDIKPDNICVQQKKDGTYRLKLMDFGMAKRLNYDDREPFGDAILSNYKKQYKDIISVNDFKQKNIPVEGLNVTKFVGNIYWAIRPSIYPRYSGFKSYDDVEAVALSLWGLYDKNGLPWTDKYNKYGDKIPKNVRYEILKQRLNENLCPFEILREVLREAWNGSKMDLEALIKKLKQNY